MKTSEKRYRKHWIIRWAASSLIFFSSSASAEFRHFDEWTKTEKALFTSYVAASYIDHRQTRVGLRNGYTEGNKLIYGSNPHRDKSIIINSIIIGGVYTLIGKHEPGAFDTVLLGGSVARWGAVIHNDSIGVSWKVAF
jgi:hypothetical protein